MLFLCVYSTFLSGNSVAAASSKLVF